MEADEFALISGLICEANRAKMLWNLLDGRAYTASELALVCDISATAASNHLSKLLQADVVKAEVQGRHRYYSFSKPEVAYVIESLASLSGAKTAAVEDHTNVPKGIKFCRTCYDHLAGYVGVKLAATLEAKGYIKKQDAAYAVSKKGWHWFAELNISKSDVANGRRAVARQCLDWSERLPHLAGALGAALLQKMLQEKWFKKTTFSRELAVTAKGRQELFTILGIDL